MKVCAALMILRGRVNCLNYVYSSSNIRPRLLTPNDQIKFCNFRHMWPTFRNYYSRTVCGVTATQLKCISLHSPTSKFINIPRMWLPYMTPTLKQSVVRQACQMPLAVLSLLLCADWQPSSQSNGAWCYVESNASVSLKIKVKSILQQATATQRGSRRIVLLFL